jgi:hypothetical protein
VTGAPSKSEKVLTALEAIGGEGTAAEISQATQEEFGPQNHVPKAGVSYFLVREDTVEVDKDGPDAAIFRLNDEADDDEQLPPLPEDLEGQLTPDTVRIDVLRAMLATGPRGESLSFQAVSTVYARGKDLTEDRAKKRVSSGIQELKDRGLVEDAGHGEWSVPSPTELDEPEDVRDDRGANQEEADDIEQLEQTDDDVDENLDEDEHNDVDHGDADDVDADGQPPAPRPIKMGSGLSERELELLEAAMEDQIGTEYAKRDAWMWVRARQLLGWGPP